MPFDWWTLALQTVNFAVLVWLLHRFLYKPVLRAIDARRDEIARQYAVATAAEAEAREKVAAIAAERQAIAAEREAMLSAAVAQANDVGETIRAKAKRDADDLLDGARRTLAQERDQALAEARHVALDLGAEAARRVLAAAPEARMTDAGLEPIERHLAALSKPEMTALLRQVGNGTGVRVVTAAALPSEAAEAWRNRLQRAVGAAIDVAFAVDPALISGAELYFPGAVLRFSGQSQLIALRREIESHDHAS
jgi:F-type H+-transporting ATPase subunit b